ncbi:MAG: HNH endonuclease [Deltaproteobacteria bacterium]|nr:HNH endonuclease [Deltaproteobacteria bacterium]
MRFIYSQEQLYFLCLGYKEIRLPELTQAFNEKFDLDKSEKAIKTALSSRGFTCGRKPGLVKGERSVLFTKEQVSFIKEQYKTYSRNELTVEFNKKFKTEIRVSQIVSCVHNQGINCGRDGHFGKGHVSWNKGTKGLTSANSGSFIKGTVPPNWQPVGSERITKDGYVEVKINEPNPYVKGQMTRWKLKHLYLWIKENGSLPVGHMLTFLDGDKENCEQDNLMLISRAVNAYLNRNSYGDLAGELKLSAIAIARVAQKASSLKKEAAAV